MIPARLLSLGPSLQPNTFNQTWVALVALASGQRQVVLKVLSPRQFFNELLAAVIGKTLGLNIPETYMVIAPNDPALSGGIPLSSGERMCFGSELAPYPAFNKALKVVNPLTPAVVAALTTAINGWPGCGEAIAFDTWLANVDRNAGNILFNPAGIHILIDHGHCLTGPNWTQPDLGDPGKQEVNKLADAVAQYVQDAQDIASTRQTTARQFRSRA